MSNEYEVTKLEIAKLDIKSGEALAVKILGGRPSMSELERINNYMKDALPDGVKVVIFHREDIELSVISSSPKTINQMRRENGFAPLQGGNVYSKTRPTKRALDAAIALKNWLVRLFTPRQ